MRKVIHIQHDEKRNSSRVLHPHHVSSCHFQLLNTTSRGLNTGLLTSCKETKHTLSRHTLPLPRPTLRTLWTALSLLGDSQGARRAGGAGAEITSHPGITALTLPASSNSPTSQVLKRSRTWREREREQSVGQADCVVYV